MTKKNMMKSFFDRATFAANGKRAGEIHKKGGREGDPLTSFFPLLCLQLFFATEGKLRNGKKIRQERKM